tara:strand:+ start:653 stop:1141 length:489 start_codon:yes stop_codon:yes gene_type:complete
MMNKKNDIIYLNDGSVEETVQQIKDNARDGKVWVEIFNRDIVIIDFPVIRKKEVEATLDALFALQEQVHLEAEGVCRIRILTQAEANTEKEKKMNRSNEKVMARLKDKGNQGVTYNDFGRGFRLSSRIHELRNSGNEIMTIQESHAGGHHARYFLIRENQNG